MSDSSNRRSWQWQSTRSITVHRIDFIGTSKLCTPVRYMDRLVKEAIETRLHSKNFNRDEGFSLSHTWLPVVNMLKRSSGERMEKEDQTDTNMTPSTSFQLAGQYYNEWPGELCTWGTMDCGIISHPWWWGPRWSSECRFLLFIWRVWYPEILLKYENIYSCLEYANCDNQQNKENVKLHKSWGNTVAKNKIFAYVSQQLRED
jgi:hypothetical protein